MPDGSGSTQQGSPRDPGAPATTGQLAQLQQQVNGVQQQVNGVQQQVIGVQQQVNGLQQEMQQMRQEVLAGFHQLGAALANRRECRCPPDVAAQLARLNLHQGAHSAAAARSSSVGEQHG
jgi:capsule polysaccharide export protein KpsE/RkpR